MARYAGLPRAYGIYKIEEQEARGKRKGKAETLQRPVTAELWQQHLDGEIQLGIVPIRDDGSCVFGAIDIDDYKLDHKALEVKILKLKLPLVMIRSKSGGAHLTLFLQEPHPAGAVRERLADWAAALGYSGVEIFPKQDRLLSVGDTGNWINMPYCGGDDSDRCALVGGDRLTLDEFFALVKKRATKLSSAPTTEDEAPELLTEGPPCLITIAAQGAGEGGRNTTVFNFGVYCRKRWPDDWAERLKELNANFVQPPLDDSELVQIIAHISRKDYTYTCKDRPLAPLCKKAQCLKRKYGLGPEDAQEYFGIDLKNVLRVEFDEPVYYADFNGKRFSFQAPDLNSMTKFRELLIGAVNEAFMPVPAPRWAQFIMQICNKAEIAEPPPETRVNAEIVGWLEDYCVEQIPGQDWPDVIDGQVLEQEGRMYFLPRKWVAQMSKDHRQRLEISRAFQALSSIGVESTDQPINGKRYKVWSVPTFARPERKKKGDGM